MLSAGVHTEQFRIMVGPPQTILSAYIHPLGGQSGGQPRARRNADETDIDRRQLSRLHAVAFRSSFAPQARSIVEVSFQKRFRDESSRK